MLTKKGRCFYDRPLSTDLAYYVLSLSIFQFIFKIFCGTFEQNVVVLYPSAQRSRVFPLLDIDNIIINNNNNTASA